MDNGLQRMVIWFDLKFKNMTIHTLKSWQVGKDNGLFLLCIGFKHYDLGMQVHSWGLRFMFIWWHVCIHF